MENKFFITMEEAFAIVRDKPEMEMLFWGIPNTPGVSIIAGKAKSGKTIFVENLVYALVNPNQSEFMGMDIPTLERIAIVSFEEILENRSRRELKQITKYDPDNELEIPKKVAVLNDTPFILLNTDEDYVELINHLKEIEPQAVFIDSLGRTGSGKIEESEVAKRIMFALRNISKELNCPVIVIHHTVKIKAGETYDLSSIAGSRYIGQESDAILMIKDGFQSGTRTITPIAFRYFQTNDENIHFTITDDCLTECISSQGQPDTDTKLQDFRLEKLYEFVCSSGSKQTNEIQKFMEENHKVSRSTTFTDLKKSKLKKNEKGVYCCPDNYAASAAHRITDEEE